jgi:hypothetical protein
MFSGRNTLKYKGFEGVFLPLIHKARNRSKSILHEGTIEKKAKSKYNVYRSTIYGKFF